MRKIGRVLSGAAVGIMALILLLNISGIAIRAMTGKDTAVFGLSSAVVLTGSMSDAIEPGDLIVTWQQDGYQVGDIVMYQGNTSTVTHRIIAIEADGYLTKGDANNTDDGMPIPQEKIVGKVIITLPGVGNVLLFFRTPLGLLILTLAVLLPICASVVLGRKGLEKGEADGKEGEIRPE